jgi:hypothetical protein
MSSTFVGVPRLINSSFRDVFNVKKSPDVLVAFAAKNRGSLLVERPW